jgi:hypothetical protein
MERFAYGSAVRGVPFMKFTLTYEGDLRSNKGPEEKWEIRKQLAPQLEELWQVSAPLVDLKVNPMVPTTQGYLWSETHHSTPQPAPPPFAFVPSENWTNVLTPIVVGGRKFFPLIRESLALQCFLKITFLRREGAGRIYQGGDIDNRLKTFFDALAVPNSDQIVADPTMDDPIHCLLEDDRLISGFSVETDRLLARPNATKHAVHLILNVETRVTDPRLYNQRFLGD